MKSQNYSFFDFDVIIEFWRHQYFYHKNESINELSYKIDVLVLNFTLSNIKIDVLVLVLNFTRTLCFGLQNFFLVNKVDLLLQWKAKITVFLILTSSLNSDVTSIFIIRMNQLMNYHIKIDVLVLNFTLSNIKIDVLVLNFTFFWIIYLGEIKKLYHQRKHFEIRWKTFCCNF